MVGWHTLYRTEEAGGGGELGEREGRRLKGRRRRKGGKIRKGKKRRSKREKEKKGE